MGIMRNVICVIILFWGADVLADKYYLHDGRVIEGKHALVSRVDERINTPEFTAKPIIVIDDGLRFITLSKIQVRQMVAETPPRPITFKTGHRINLDGIEYLIPGSYSNSTPFDEYGRRRNRPAVG